MSYSLLHKTCHSLLHKTCHIVHYIKHVFHKTCYTMYYVVNFTRIVLQTCHIAQDIIYTF